MTRFRKGIRDALLSIIIGGVSSFFAVRYLNKRQRKNNQE